jgi:RimJ/RimL family protein N-acetyltransferase
VSQRPEPVRDRAPSANLVDPLPPGLWPERTALEGRYMWLEPLDARQHAAELYDASHGSDDALRIWDYLAVGPYPSVEAFAAYLRSCSASADPVFYAIRDLATGKASGVASYLNIVPANGSIEIGHIWFGPALQNTPAATEALYTLNRHAFDDLGYRRMEWKCNALNAGSRSAAVRLGFAFEGIFYNHMVAKGRNRDTAWFSIIDEEWPALRECYEAWLAPDNFDAAGRQRSSLGDLTAAVRGA